MNTGAPCLIVDVLLIKVSVGDSDQPPEDCEHEPAEEEAQAENQQRPSPLDVDQGGDDVGQVAPPPLRQVALDDVQLAVLEDDALAELACADAVANSVGMEERLLEATWERDKEGCEADERRDV